MSYAKNKLFYPGLNHTGDTVITDAKSVDQNLDDFDRKTCKLPHDIWTRVALSEIIPAQISDGVMLVTNQWILPRILGMSDI